MKLKRKQLVVLVTVLLLIAVSMLFASCQPGVGPANPFSKNTTTSSQSATTSSQSATSSGAASSGTVSGTTQSTTTGNPVTALLSRLGIPLILVVAFYFILIRPQRKKDKQTSKMRNELQVGDEITTIGGIVGKIVQIKDQDQLVIETGSDKSRIRIKRWAIQEKNTISD